MIALDTNILARLLLADDAAQLVRVKALLAKKQTYTATVTVMLELVWVLEANDCSPGEIEHGLGLLMGLSNFVPDRVLGIKEALTWYAQGMDFADALHLALSADATQLLTFDKKFVKLAKSLDAGTVVAIVP